MKFKSGVYLVHYDDIPLFVETAKAQGLRFAGNYEEITREIYKNTYRPFLIDVDSVRMSYWSICSLKALKTGSDWDFTERFIEHWQPKQKKVIL